MRYKLLCGMHSGEFRGCYEFALDMRTICTSPPTPSTQIVEGEACDTMLIRTARKGGFLLIFNFL